MYLQKQHCDPLRLTTPDLPDRAGIKRAATSGTGSPKSSTNTVGASPKPTTAVPKAKQERMLRHSHLIHDIPGHEQGTGTESRKSPICLRRLNSDPRAQHTPREIQETRDASKIHHLERMLTLADEELRMLRKELDGTRAEIRGDFFATETFSPEQDATGQSRQSSSFRISDTEQMRGYGQNLHPNHETRHRITASEGRSIERDFEEHSDQLARNEAQWNELRHHLRLTEKESQERLHQLILLKAEISSLTRIEPQITDGELVDSLVHIASRVREWVVTNFRRSRLVLREASPEVKETLISTIGRFETDRTVNKFALCQAVIGSIITKILQEPLIFGLPETGPFAGFKECIAALRSSGPAYDSWRRTTVLAIEQSHLSEFVQQSSKDALQSLLEKAVNLLFSLTSTGLSSQAQAILIQILGTVATLQRTIALQRARYRFLFFCRDKEDVGLDISRMEAINDDGIDDDGNALSLQDFLFCAFPCVEKLGEEWGKGIEKCNILLKAKVCGGVG